jgi:chromosome segregation ATPase
MTTKLNAAPAWSPELNPELRDALATAERAAADTARIEAAIAATRDQLTAAGAELERTRTALAATEAESALAGSAADRQARKSLIAARDEADFLAARLTGLEARHQTAASTLLEARRNVAIAWRNWQRAQAADYLDRIYIPALEQFVAAIRGVTAAASALGHNRLNAIARHTVLCDPSDPERNPANPRRSNWQTDPVSGPLYQHLSEIAATVRPYLEGFEDAPTLAETTDAA